MSEPAADWLTTAASTRESPATSVAAAKSRSGTASAPRLVIRIRIPEGVPLRAPVRRGLSRRAIALILVTVAVAVSWVGVSMFRTDETPAPAVTATAPKSQSLAPVPASNVAAAVASDEPLPKAATATAATRSVTVEPRSTQATAVESVRKQPATLPSSINEVIPNVPQSARDTIRGTIRVSVQVIVDQRGTVLDATADEPGPSRYFARLAVAAAKKWTFAPTDLDEQRIMLVRFYFTRAGTTARARPKG